MICKIWKDKAAQNRQFAEKFPERQFAKKTFPERQFAKKCSRRKMFKIYKSWSTTTNSPPKYVSRYECGLRSLRCLLGPVIFSSRANFVALVDVVVVAAYVIFVAVVFAAALPGLCFLRSRGISALRGTHKHFTALAAILFVCCFITVISWWTFFNGL